METMHLDSDHVVILCQSCNIHIVTGVGSGNLLFMGILSSYQLYCHLRQSLDHLAVNHYPAPLNSFLFLIDNLS